MPNPPAPAPIDRARLKQAADRLAALLEDFRTGGLQLATGDRFGWLVQPQGDGHHGVYARVDDPHGYWDTTEVNGPDTAPEPSLADRLRAMAAEIEALTADKRCDTQFDLTTGLSTQQVRCELEAGHPGNLHVGPVPGAPFEKWQWTDGRPAR